MSSSMIVTVILTLVNIYPSSVFDKAIFFTRFVLQEPLSVPMITIQTQETFDDSSCLKVSLSNSLANQYRRQKLLTGIIPRLLLTGHLAKRFYQEHFISRCAKICTQISYCQKVTFKLPTTRFSSYT